MKLQNQEQELAGYSPEILKLAQQRISHYWPKLSSQTSEYKDILQAQCRNIAWRDLPRVDLTGRDYRESVDHYGDYHTLPTSFMRGEE
jgi:hypothetical protein